MICIFIKHKQHSKETLKVLLHSILQFHLLFKEQLVTHNQTSLLFGGVFF